MAIIRKKIKEKVAFWCRTSEWTALVESGDKIITKNRRISLSRVVLNILKLAVFTFGTYKKPF